MACYHPTPAYQKGPGLPVEFWPTAHLQNLMIPCGKCIGCRSARATAWAHRCAHEASQYDNNIFLTLTYDDDNIPRSGHLDPRHLQLFTKRLRQDATRHESQYQRDPTHPIRYFACGEYGEWNGRPHYHALLFNCDFRDKYTVGKELYEAPTLSTLWTYGIANFGTARPGAANYIAQYSLKKQYHKPQWFNETDGYVDEDGVWYPRTRPFLRMSNRPAIGTGWLDTYQTDLRHGYLLENQYKHTIPRTYKLKLKETNPTLYDEIQRNIDRDRALHKTTTEYQLRAGEIIHRRLKQLTEARNL